MCDKKRQSRFLKRNAESFRIGKNKVLERWKSWGAFEKRAEEYFDAVCAEAKNVGLFENLYVETRTKPNVVDKKYPPYINVYFGQHPTGLYDFTAAPNVTALDSEGGCALAIDQSPTGDVVCFLFPFKSNLRKLNDVRYVYKGGFKSLVQHLSMLKGEVLHVKVSAVEFVGT